jgi:hypothetical protein
VLDLARGALLRLLRAPRDRAAACVGLAGHR